MLTFFVQNLLILIQNSGYQYSVTEIQKYHTWKVTNGTIDQPLPSYGSSYIYVTWSKNALYGIVEAEGQNISNQKISLFMSVRINNPEIQPRAENVTINTSPNPKTFKSIDLSLTYDLINCLPSASATITWTINNVGSIQTFTGNNISYIPKKVGSTIITADYNVNSGIENGTTQKERIIGSATKTIYIDGEPGVPTLTEITMPSSYIVPKEPITFFCYGGSIPLPPYIRLHWKAEGTSVTGTKYGTSQVTDDNYFTLGRGYTGRCVVTCQAENINYGTFSNTVRIDFMYGSYPMTRSIGSLVDVNPDLYKVISSCDELIISNKGSGMNTTSNEAISTMISYQIYGLSTGVLFDSGVCMNKGSIDTSKLPKGMYVIVLNDGIKEESHKFVIKKAALF